MKTVNQSVFLVYSSGFSNFVFFSKSPRFSKILNQANRSSSVNRQHRSAVFVNIVIHDMLILLFPVGRAVWRAMVGVPLDNYVGKRRSRDGNWTGRRLVLR
jgi:hypothetical protein